MSLLMAETIYLFPYSNRYVCDFSLYKKISTTCQTSWQRAFKTKTSEFQQTFTQFWHVKNSTLFHSSSSMFQIVDRVILDTIYIPGISFLKNTPCKQYHKIFNMYCICMKVFKHPNIEFNRKMVIRKFLFVQITFVSRIFYCSHK